MHIVLELSELAKMASYLWRKYADHVYSKWEKTILWDMIEPYRRPKSFTPLVSIYIVAFYTGVIGAAITEQLYKEKYWEEHPGEAVPLMKPKFYGGPWRKLRRPEMTTYGTIPTAGNPSTSTTTSNLEFVSRAKERIRSGLGKRRPWQEVLAIHSFSLPSSFNEALLRVRTNLAYFCTNYIIVVLLILFLSLLWHPISLIVFIVMMAAWLFLYFLREEPLVLLGRIVDDRFVLVVLAVLTLLFLFLTDVTTNILVSLAISAVVIVVHGAVRRTDDLPANDFDDEAGTRVVYRGGGGGQGARMPLKDTASSSFSS
ncbi:hypothetical protein Ancab_018000 [Ancistrocladus abbreviatus]